VPLVSVIVPTYNCARFLGQAIESVLAQDYSDLEVVVVDDGSTDGTEELVRRFPPRVRYFRQDNRGPGAARNLGLARAEGELLAFLDSDDLWMPSKLSRQVEVLERDAECGVVCSDARVIDAEGGLLEASNFQRNGFDLSRTNGWVFEYELIQPFILPSSAIIRRKVATELGGFDESLALAQTTDFFVRASYRYRVRCLPEQLVMRRRHDSNISRDHDGRALRYRTEVVARCLALPLRPLYRLRVRHLLGELHRRLGRHELGNGRRAEARADFGRSLSSWPVPNSAVGYLALTYAPVTALAALRRLRHGRPAGGRAARAGAR
jgi:glycosyltransferase involved in cell wall biosynthesis